MKVTYDKDLTGLVLDAFDKKADTEGYLVEKSNPSQRVLTSDGNEIPRALFGGDKRGSELYVSSDLVSIINLCKYLADKEK